MMRATARWSLDAMSSASVRAKGSRSTWGTTWLTSPHTSAVWAST